MNQHVYDRDQAQKLTVLLRAIGREIRERSSELERLEAELDGPRSGPRGSGDRDDARRRSLIESRYLEHRRALRAAESELASLGCRIDDDHPLRVLIPGIGLEDGGFAFDVSSGDLESLQS